MKLYYSPGACSFSPHVVAREAGIDLVLDRVDMKTKTTADGRDFREVNPNGYVPALELDNGEVLTEGPAIVQHLADLRPERGLAPANGTFARVRLQEMLGYINSELHKTYSPLFRTETPPDVRSEREAHLRQRYGIVEAILVRQPYLLGEQFTVADAYLFTVTAWADFLKLDFSAYPGLAAFQQRVGARPSVQAARAAERQVV